MKIYMGKRIDIHICKSGKGQKWYLKPYESPHIASVCEMRFHSDETYLVTSYWMAHFIQFFWLWFIIGIDIKKEKISETKMVNFNATHYASIEDALK